MHFGLLLVHHLVCHSGVSLPTESPAMFIRASKPMVQNCTNDSRSTRLLIYVFLQPNVSENWNAIEVGPLVDGFVLLEKGM